jgi:hypothetical protein
MDRYTFSSEWSKRAENLLNKFEETENTDFYLNHIFTCGFL